MKITILFVDDDGRRSALAKAVSAAIPDATVSFEEDSLITANAVLVCCDGFETAQADTVDRLGMSLINADKFVTAANRIKLLGKKPLLFGYGRDGDLAALIFKKIAGVSCYCATGIDNAYIEKTVGQQVAEAYGTKEHLWLVSADYEKLISAINSGVTVPDSKQKDTLDAYNYYYLSAFDGIAHAVSALKAVVRKEDFSFFALTDNHGKVKGMAPDASVLVRVTVKDGVITADEGRELPLQCACVSRLDAGDKLALVDAATTKNTQYYFIALALNTELSKKYPLHELKEKASAAEKRFKSLGYLSDYKRTDI